VSLGEGQKPLSAAVTGSQRLQSWPLDRQCIILLFLADAGGRHIEKLLACEEPKGVLFSKLELFTLFLTFLAVSAINTAFIETGILSCLFSVVSAWSHC